MFNTSPHSLIQHGQGHTTTTAWFILFLLVFLCKQSLAAELNVPGDFGSIQDAINNAEANDTILVERGTYNEVLILKSDLTLRGRETAQTFINPGSGNTAITISVLSNVTIANFTFINAQTGVSVSNNSNNINVSNNVFDVGLSNTGFQVVDLSLNVSVENNTFYRNGTAISRLQAASKIQNNIFFENTVALATGGNTLNILYNCFFGNGDSDNVGNNVTTGNPLFSDPGARDFHLQTDSPCIDVGTGVDVIDNTTADTGAYGGSLADKFPFPTPQPSASDTSTSASGPFNITLSWTANLAYLVNGYDVYYGKAPGTYNGTDAEGGTKASPIDAGNVTSFELKNLNPVAGTPSTPILNSVTPSNRTLSLQWTAASQATGYRVNYGVASVNENVIDVGNVTSYDLGGLENGTTYQIAIQAIAQQIYYLATKVYDSTAARNASDFSAEQSIAVGPINQSALSNSLTGLPEEVLAFPALPNEGCFIATAAYGADFVPEVKILREFRDLVLLTNGAGRSLVELYYRYSPPVATVIENRGWLKTLVRTLLLPIVLIAVFILQATALPKLIVTLLLLSLMWRIASRLVARVLKHRVKNSGGATRCY